MLTDIPMSTWNNWMISTKYSLSIFRSSTYVFCLVSKALVRSTKTWNRPCCSWHLLDLSCCKNHIYFPLLDIILWLAVLYPQWEHSIEKLYHDSSFIPLYNSIMIAYFQPFGTLPALQVFRMILCIISPPHLSKDVELSNKFPHVQLADKCFYFFQAKSIIHRFHCFLLAIIW